MNNGTPMSKKINTLISNLTKKNMNKSPFGPNIRMESERRKLENYETYLLTWDLIENNTAR